ncbi:MAG: DNA polymerase, partial [bacterium]
VSPRTEKPTYAFAKDDLAFQELLEHRDPNVRDLVEARLAVSTSIEETRALRLLSHAQPALPLYLNYGKAHTLRWSGGDRMNPQNFGRESLLRRAILAPPGHKLVIVDSAQIEARVNAWLAGETALVEAFRSGRDIYSEFAAESVFGCAREEIDKPKRFVGKVSVLGLGYGTGAAKFQDTLESGRMGMTVVLPEEMYPAVVFAYRNRFQAIRQQWYVMEEMLKVMFEGREIVEYGPLTFERDKARLPNGMYLRYPHLKPGSVRRVCGTGGGMFKTQPTKTIYRDWTYNGGKRIYGAHFVENLCQALARCIVAEQILTVADRYRVVLMVHDEAVLCVPEHQAEQALKDTLRAFHTPRPWCPDLPVAGEGKINDFYAKG